MSRLSRRISHLPREPQKVAIFCQWVINSLLWFFALLGYWTLLELHAMVELWYLLKSSLRILTRCLQSYLITLLINTPEKATSIKVSRHFSSSPLKTGFSSPQKFSEFLVVNVQLSSILACLDPIVQSRSNVALTLVSAASTTNWLHTDIFSPRVWKCSYVSWF